MSRRKIFEGVRRRPVGRRRFLLAADVLEERTLLSTLFATLPDPVGVTTAFFGDVFVSYNSGTSSSPQESIAAYTGSGNLDLPHRHDQERAARAPGDLGIVGVSTDPGYWRHPGDAARRPALRLPALDLKVGTLQ